MKNIPLLLLSLLLTGFLAGCNKFLDEKTDKKLVVPTRLADLQALLDNDGNMNISDPGEGEIAADDYYLPETTWASLSNEYDRRAYTWEPDYITTHTSWFAAYRYVYYANIILEHLGKLPEADSRSVTQRDNVAGQAYYLRARGHLAVQLIWAPAFDESTADTDMGVPLRLASDFNIASFRSANREVYSQIAADLQKAIALLPERPGHVIRASKPAAQALLARVHLFMRDYEQCRFYADSCLQLWNSLMDYNDLDALAAYPMAQFNTEVIHHSILRTAHQPIQQSRALVDTSLYAAFEDDDLRKVLFFRDNGNGTHGFKGSYNGNNNNFSGVGVDEVFLMRAECRARLGDVGAAMDDLNYLLTHRYKAGRFTPLRAATPQEALRLILTERRKELLFRGLRFPDVKRLNKEGAGISFTRYMEESGRSYTLPANDPRFALWISDAVLENAPGIIQNPR